MPNPKEVISQTSELVGGVVDGLKGLVSVFFPKAAPGAELASKVLKKLSELDDKQAEQNVLGLTATAQALENLLKAINSGKKVDDEEVKKLLSEATENIKAIDAGLDKFYKTIS